VKQDIKSDNGLLFLSKDTGFSKSFGRRLTSFFNPGQFLHCLSQTRDLWAIFFLIATSHILIIFFQISEGSLSDKFDIDSKWEFSPKRKWRSKLRSQANHRSFFCFYSHHFPALVRLCPRPAPHAGPHPARPDAAHPSLRDRGALPAVPSRPQGAPPGKVSHFDYFFILIPTLKFRYFISDQLVMVPPPFLLTIWST